jgi:hypothetical protein
LAVASGRNGDRFKSSKDRIVAILYIQIPELSCRSQLELKSSSLVTMANFIRGIIESCDEADWSNSSIPNDVISNGSRNKMAVEALQVLTYVIHEN